MRAARSASPITAGPAPPDAPTRAAIAPASTDRAAPSARRSREPGADRRAAGLGRGARAASQARSIPSKRTGLRRASQRSSSATVRSASSASASRSTRRSRAASTARSRPSLGALSRSVMRLARSASAASAVPSLAPLSSTMPLPISGENSPGSSASAATRTGSGSSAAAAASTTRPRPTAAASVGSAGCMPSASRASASISGIRRASAPQACSIASIRDGRRSIRPRETSCQIRSGTSASTSPAATIAHMSSRVSGATVKRSKRAAKRATRRMRTGSSAKASLTCRSTPSCRSRRPPQGSMIVPSAARAIALIVRSRRRRSSSRLTSGAHCTTKPR